MLCISFFRTIKVKKKVPEWKSSYNANWQISNKRKMGTSLLMHCDVMLLCNLTVDIASSLEIPSGINSCNLLSQRLWLRLTDKCRVVTFLVSLSFLSFFTFFVLPIFFFSFHNLCLVHLFLGLFTGKHYLFGWHAAYDMNQTFYFPLKGPARWRHELHCDSKAHRGPI